MLVVGRGLHLVQIHRYPLVKSFHGFDYVTVPNYISLDKKSLMLESAEERDAAIHAALIEQGFTDNAATDLVHHFSAMKNQQAMLESAHREATESELMLLEVENIQLRDKLRAQTAMMESQGEKCKSNAAGFCVTLSGEMPVFISAEQRRALCRMQSEDDARIVAAMLESLGGKCYLWLTGIRQERARVITEGEQKHHPRYSSFRDGHNRCMKLNF